MESTHGAAAKYLEWLFYGIPQTVTKRDMHYDAAKFNTNVVKILDPDNNTVGHGKVVFEDEKYYMVLTIVDQIIKEEITDLDEVVYTIP